MHKDDLALNDPILVQQALPFAIHGTLREETDTPETKRMKNQIYEYPLSLYWINGEVFVASSFSTSLSAKFYYQSIRGYVSGKIHEEPENFSIEDFFLNKVGYDRGSFGIYVTTRTLIPKFNEAIKSEATTDHVGWVSLVGLRARVEINRRYGLPKPPDIRNDFKNLLAFLLLLGVTIDPIYISRVQEDLDYIYEGT